ncbi:hypothetical protein FSP39_023940 [Pinctada imbricata]|uniref:Uncharacterized protein n=1 Tax=Pinctada imbricata TaxID=66713 RepID=A0AA89BXZ8_PINIB|nr:hypothetical protein FSP39_023940 [Pinctada imbricata]
MGNRCRLRTAICHGNSRRNYSDPPWDLTTHQEDATFCTSMCHSSKNELAHEISSCLYKSDNRVDLLLKSCSDKFPSSNIEFKLRKCSLKRMYELNNTFFTVCPNRFVYSGKFCASECDAEYQYLAPKTRMCLKACSNQLLKYRNECIEICPTKTRIINTECKDISKCPEHLPISLQRKEGTYCLNECPSKYYLDERTCVDNCNGKKVVNRRCTATCPISHPFEKKSYILNDIPECYDSCPGNEIGDMQTFKCIDKYECKSYVFDRKCHEKCPDSTFGYKSSTNSEKGCEYIYKIKIAIAFAVILPCLTTVIFVLFVCIEEHTLKEKFTQHMQPWFQRNETAETYMYHPREHAAGFQIEEVNNEHVEQLAEENTCLLSSDYEMRYFDNQHEEYVQEQPSFDNRR